MIRIPTLTALVCVLFSILMLQAEAPEAQADETVPARFDLPIAEVSDGNAEVSDSGDIPAPPIEYNGHLYRQWNDVVLDENGIAWRPTVVTTTAYAPTVDECDDDPDTTATGSDAYATYGVAADPRALPYGTVVRIPGYGDARVDDTGRAMRRSWRKGHIQLDLRIPLRRFDGVWRSESECVHIAKCHGVQAGVVVLIQVPILQQQ